MAIRWTEYLETGIDWQDSQHKELFSRINRLLEAMSKSRGKEEIINLIRFLDSYVVLHFTAEESAMNRLNYPGKDLHRLEHDKFKRDIAAIKKEIESGVDILSVIKVHEQAVDWLINHIGKVDKELGMFLVQA